MAAKTYVCAYYISTQIYWHRADSELRAPIARNDFIVTAMVIAHCQMADGRQVVESRRQLFAVTLANVVRLRGMRKSWKMVTPWLVENVDDWSSPKI